MNWPLITLARHLMEVAALNISIADLNARLAAAEARARAAETDAERFRGYYERLMDDTLMRTGQASGKTHEVDLARGVDRQIARAFGLVGSPVGAPITGPRHAAEPATAKR